MKPWAIAVVIVALLVGAVFFWGVFDHKVRVTTADTHLEGTIVMKDTSGKETQVKRLFTGSTSSNGSYLKEFKFNLDVKFKTSEGDNAWILSSMTDKTHATELIIRAQTSGDSVDVKKIPLSSFTNSDFTKTKTGEWYHLFKDVKLTATELESKMKGKIWSYNFDLVFSVDLWYSLTGEKSEEVNQVTVDIGVPIKIVVAELVNPNPNPIDWDPSVQPIYLGAIGVTVTENPGIKLQR